MNQILVKNKYSLSKVYDLLDILVDASYFSHINLKSEYNWILIDEADELFLQKLEFLGHRLDDKKNSAWP